MMDFLWFLPVCTRKIGFMPISLVKSDQLHLLCVQDPLIIDCQGFFALSNVAILEVDAIREEGDLLVLLKLSIPHVMANILQVEDEMGAASNLQNHVLNAKHRATEVGLVWMKIKMKSEITHLRLRHQDGNFSLLNNVELCGLDGIVSVVHANHNLLLATC